MARPGEDDDEHVQQAFHVQTRMLRRNGTALLVDPGAHDDLCSDSWANEQAEAALAAGRPRPTITPLSSPITVGGVGRGSQTVDEEFHVDIGVSGKVDHFF